MRGIESVILAIVVGLLGVGVWYGQPLLPGWDSKPKTVYPAASAMTDAALWVNGTPDVPAAATRSPGPIRPTRHHTSAVFRTAIDSGATTVVPVPWASSVPRAGEMMIGTTGAQLRSSFGDPMLQTALTRNGRLIQRYYYFNDDQTQFTVATLENGRVVAAEGAAR